jgi:anti-sigma regulatory factor (Ser/Thr protein kinase)
MHSVNFGMTLHRSHGAGSIRRRMPSTAIVASVSSSDARLSIDLPATPESVGAARRALASFCAGQGASRETTDRVLLSVSEAVTNALVHAYRHLERPADERIELEASCEDDHLRVMVRDFGCGMAPRLDSPGLGLGLPLIAASTISVQIDAPPEGGRTEIAMEFALHEQPVEI